MIRRLLCRLGLHTEHLDHLPDGFPIWRCDHCPAWRYGRPSPAHRR